MYVYMCVQMCVCVCIIYIKTYHIHRIYIYIALSTYVLVLKKPCSLILRLLHFHTRMLDLHFDKDSQSSQVILMQSSLKPHKKHKCGIYFSPVFSDVTPIYEVLRLWHCDASFYILMIL